MSIKQYMASAEWGEKIPGMPWSAEELFNKDRNAYELVRILLRACNIWDDLIDGDKPVDKEQINYAFTALSHDLNRNAFYVAFNNELLPMYTNSIISWLTANYFEEQLDDFGIDIAYGLRYAVVQMCAHVIYLVHGARIDVAMKYTPELYLALYQDRFDEYRIEIYEQGREDARQSA